VFSNEHPVHYRKCYPARTPVKSATSKKDDKIDARKLAKLLHLNNLKPVYHGENGIRTLKELSRSYLTMTKDLGRVMTCVTQIEIG
jgi:hypothetical protein